MKYRIVIDLTTERELTIAEQELLAMTLYVMADEPVDEDGESAEWTAANVDIDLQLVDA